MYTSTGEVTLEEHLRRGNLELDAVLLLRFAHIPSDAGKGYGVFECINYGTAPQDIGNHINELASNHYTMPALNGWNILLKIKIQPWRKPRLYWIALLNSIARLKWSSQPCFTPFRTRSCSWRTGTQAGITGWQQGRAFDSSEMF